MARAVYSVRFLEAVGLAGTAVYNVLPGFKAVVRDVDAYASAGLTPRHGTLHGPSGGTVDWFVCDPDTTVLHQWRGRQVYEPGEQITYIGDGGVDVMISGYLLSLP